MTRYLSGLCVGGLGLCGGGWLVVAAVAFGGESAGRAGRVNLVTGAVLIAVSGLSLVCWSWAWRQRMRADGVLGRAVPAGPEAAGAAEPAGAQPGRPARRQARGAVGPRRQARRPPVVPARQRWCAQRGRRAGRGRRPRRRRGRRRAVQHAPPYGGLTVADLGGAGRNGGAHHRVGANGRRRRCRASRSGRQPGGARGGIDQRTALDAGAAAGRHRRPAACSPGSPRWPGSLAPAEQPGPAGQAAAAAPPLPQRTRFASAARPRLTPAEMAAPRVRQAPMSIPRLAAVDDSPGPRATARTPGGEPGRAWLASSRSSRPGSGWSPLRSRSATSRPAAGWTGATKTDVITGGLLAVAGFAGLFGVAAGRAAELYADARSAASLAGTADRENSGS